METTQATADVLAIFERIDREGEKLVKEAKEFYSTSLAPIMGGGVFVHFLNEILSIWTLPDLKKHGLYFLKSSFSTFLAFENLNLIQWGIMWAALWELGGD